MPAVPSFPIPAVLVKLAPHQHDTGRLRAHLQRVPDPRSRRGRWYPLVGLLLICACAVVSGARTVTEITEWGQRSTTSVLEQFGIRRHLPGRRRAPSHATVGLLLFLALCASQFARGRRVNARQFAAAVTLRTGARNPIDGSAQVRSLLVSCVRDAALVLVWALLLRNTGAGPLIVVLPQVLPVVFLSLAAQTSRWQRAHGVVMWRHPRLPDWAMPGTLLYFTTARIKPEPRPS